MISQPVPPQREGDVIGNCAWNPAGGGILIEVAARLW